MRQAPPPLPGFLVRLVYSDLWQSKT
jgi:hypothetical protein